MEESRYGDEKLGAAQAALAAARSHFAQAPGNGGAAAALVRALAAFGDLLKSRGDLDGALAAYREGLRVGHDAASLAEKNGAVLVRKGARPTCLRPAAIRQARSRSIARRSGSGARLRRSIPTIRLCWRTWRGVSS